MASQCSRARPRATITTATTTDSRRPSWSCRAGGGPRSTAGTASTGRASRTPVDSSPVELRTPPTRRAVNPTLTSIPACTTPPAAMPPGTTLPAAAPASWEAAMSSSRPPPRAIRSSSQRHAKLASSSTATSPNHAGLTSPRLGHASSTVSRLGATTYRPTPVTTSPTTRVPQRRAADATITPPEAGRWSSRRRVERGPVVPLAHGEAAGQPVRVTFVQRVEVARASGHDAQQCCRLGPEVQSPGAGVPGVLQLVVVQVRQQGARTGPRRRGRRDDAGEETSPDVRCESSSTVSGTWPTSRPSGDLPSRSCGKDRQAERRVHQQQRRTSGTGQHAPADGRERKGRQQPQELPVADVDA